MMYWESTSLPQPTFCGLTFMGLLDPWTAEVTYLLAELFIPQL